jgi:hypothetical protein
MAIYLIDGVFGHAWQNPEASQVLGIPGLAEFPGMNKVTT